MKLSEWKKLVHRNTVRVDAIPHCQVCSGEYIGISLTENSIIVPAHYDARIPGGFGWGYVCRRHFKSMRCKLGVGLGQRLVLRNVA